MEHRSRLMVAVGLLVVNALACSAAQGKVSGPSGRIAYGVADPAIEALHVFTVNPDGTDVQDLRLGTDGITWSPDGSKLLLTDLRTGKSPLRPATINSDGSGFERLDATVDPDLALGCSAWSPDGTRIVCQGFPEGDGGDPNLNGVYTVRASDGGRLVRVTSNPYGLFDAPGDYSPDGTRIVFLRGDPKAANESGTLFVVSTEGSGLLRITPRGFAHGATASWSPDGRWILLEHRGRVFAVRPDGTGLRQIPLQLPGSGFILSPSWSPDGAWLAFSLHLESADYLGDIYTARADGTDLTQVTDTIDGDEDGADWGPLTG